MKSFAFALICSILMIAPGYAQEKKQASPAKTTEQSIGDLDVTIKYSSPFVKERDIYGGLVPWKEVWRAGANEATTIEFSRDVEINGETLAAGTYAFFVIPMENGEFILIFNSEAKQWGAYKYDESKDALRITVEGEEIDHTESLTYSISEDGTIALDWATTRAAFTVE
ncbi:MAG: hypothetical protein CMP59_09770 [Flavobacteriales bacterium]|nr:hypothetical protein [Flavobacteriales bacterium]